jgi:hypothetical protein
MRTDTARAHVSTIYWIDGHVEVQQVAVFLLTHIYIIRFLERVRSRTLRSR